MITSRENLAYQDDFYRRYEPYETKSQDMTVLTSARPKRRTVHVVHFAVILLSAAVAALIIYNYMILTTLTDQIATRKQTIENLNSEYTYLKTKQDQILNLTYVEEYAQTKLNMIKMDKNQAEYIELNNPDQIEVTDASANLGEAVVGFVKSFNAVLEYLK